MNDEIGEVRSSTRTLVTYQFVFGVIVSMVFFVSLDMLAAISALFGAFSSIFSTLLLGSGVQKASRRAIDNPAKSMGVIYFNAIKRFLLILFFFIVGIKFLGLNPLALAVGFATAQLCFLFVLPERRKL